jgi:hypothetical protein
MTFANETSSFGLACLFLTLTCRLAAAQDCRTIAAPPPLATVDGPATAERGESEMALGAGFGGTLFDCTHKTGSAWFGRMRRGLTDRLDLGADLLVAQHQDKGTATAKIAVRYRLRKRLRLEVEAIKTVPYAPLSHPFVERLIGTIRRECLDRTPFWTAADLEMKLL